MAAVDFLDTELSQAATSRFVLRLGKAVDEKVPESGSVTSRLNWLIKAYDENPTYLTDIGEIGDAIVEAAVGFAPKPETSSWGVPPQPDPVFENFRRALAQDGLVLDAGVIRPALPADIELPSVMSALSASLDTLGMNTAKGHLEQALDAHVAGSWAAANAQIRTFIEALLDDLAERLDKTAAGLPSGHARRAKLASLGFLSVSLNEWDDSGKGYVNGLMRRLHPQGSHPGLSDEEDCTFRLHIVLLTGSLLLRRYIAASSG